MKLCSEFKGRLVFAWFWLPVARELVILAFVACSFPMGWNWSQAIILKALWFRPHTFASTKKHKVRQTTHVKFQNHRKIQKHHPCNSSQQWQKSLGASSSGHSLDAQCFGYIWISCALPATQRSPESKEHGGKSLEERTHHRAGQIIGWPYAGLFW